MTHDPYTHHQIQFSLHTADPEASNEVAYTNYARQDGALNIISSWRDEYDSKGRWVARIGRWVARIWIAARNKEKE